MTTRNGAMNYPDFSLSGRRALITGASRGIGLALARGLAHAGARVALAARGSGPALARAAETVGGGSIAVAFDVSDVCAARAGVDEAADRLGGLDILINNAGVEQICPSRDVDETLWSRIVDTNLKGAFFCAQRAARHMTEGGSVINVCSLTSEVGVPTATAYGSSKAGLLGMTRALAAEWAADGIRVNAIGPGYFRTALTEPFYRDPDWQRAMLGKIPLARFGRLDDLLGATVFLCSDAAGYITGQLLYIDGGYTAAL